MSGTSGQDRRGDRCCLGDRLATARRLTAARAAVLVVDLDGDRAAAVAAELGGVAGAVDVGDATSWSEIVEVAVATFGGIDVAVLNAGCTTGAGELAEVTDEAYRRIMRVNVDGVVFGARAVPPAIARRGGGAIVATARSPG